MHRLSQCGLNLCNARIPHTLYVVCEYMQGMRFVRSHKYKYPCIFSQFNDLHTYSNQSLHGVGQFAVYAYRIHSRPYGIICITFTCDLFYVTFTYHLLYMWNPSFKGHVWDRVLLTMKLAIWGFSC